MELSNLAIHIIGCLVSFWLGWLVKYVEELHKRHGYVSVEELRKQRPNTEG